MKKASDLSSLSLEELFEKKKKLTKIYLFLSVVMALAIAALVYLAIKSKNYALIAVGMGSLITLLAGFAGIGQIDKEIKKRNQA